MGVACQGEVVLVAAIVPDIVHIVGEQIWSIVMIFMVFLRLIRLLSLKMLAAYSFFCRQCGDYLCRGVPAPCVNSISSAGYQTGRKIGGGADR